MNTFVTGTGKVDRLDSITRMSLPHAARSIYSDAQIDNYIAQSVPRRSFPLRPPVHLSVRARFSSEKILGTAGFGLWNHPFAPNTALPALPRSIWFFFASPPSNMQLALGVNGFGWKAATIDATRLSAIALAPLAPFSLLLNRSKKLYHKIWPFIQKRLRIAEHSLDLNLMREWHTYKIDWEIDRTRFLVDDQIILDTDRSPRGPMGFIAWIDNQYAIVTPQGQFKFGLVDVEEEQWLEIESIGGI